MAIVGIIPARSGSKRLPGKNIKRLGDRPLIGWTIDAALNSDQLDRIIVSTDSEDIAEISQKIGAETPFLRPAELSGDKISDTPVLAHAVEWLEVNESVKVEYVVLLRPTVPFRRLGLIDECITRIIEKAADGVRSVRNMLKYHPYWMLTVDENGFSHAFHPDHGIDDFYQSQMLPPVFRHDGYCDVIRRSNIPSPCAPTATLKGLYGTRTAVVMNDGGPLINIDTAEDFEAAEEYLKSGINALNGERAR